MSTFSNSLVQLRNNRHITQEELAKALGVSRSTIGMYESGTREPNFETLEAIADYFNVSMGFLIGNDTSAYSVKIPVLGRVAAGIPLEAVECVLDYEEIPAELARTGEFFGLQIKGDSMSPRILEGDVVIVRKQETCATGDIAIVLVDGADATCKRVVFHESGLSLIGLNPGFAPRFYTQQEIETLPVQIIGKVVELRGKL